MRVSLLTVALVLLATHAAAQQPTAAPSTAPEAPATAAPSTAPVEPSPQAPPIDEAQPLPPGHPPMGGMAGHGGGQGPQDVLQQDASVEVGVIDVTIADVEGKPVANVPVSLAVKFETVEEGTKESTLQAHSGADGRVRFTGQKTGSAYQYRVVANREGASFPSRPFALTRQGGVRVVLHTSAPVTRLEDVSLVMDAVVMLELKDDAIAVTHLLRAVNLGQNAFITQGIVMPLPAEAAAFKEEESSDGIEVVQDGMTLLLKGTFPPGQVQATYRYQVPIESASQRLRLSLPPRVIASRIMLGAGPQMSLEVVGYPAAAVNRVGEGKRVLETGRRVDPQSVLGRVDPEMLDIRIAGMPTPGPERMIALFLVGLVLAAGVYHTYRSRTEDQGLDSEQHEDLIEARTALLNEMATLERGRRSGEVGPQSYERLHNALLDALARIQTRLEDSERAGARRAAAARAPKVRPVVRLHAESPSGTRAQAARPVQSTPKAHAEDERKRGKRKRGRKGRS